MGFMTKNYTTDGGSRTVVGGVLEFEQGAKVKNFPKEGNSPSAEDEGNGGKAVLPILPNQRASTANWAAELRDDFNRLLEKLKEAGLMESDGWLFSVRLAPAPPDAAIAANNQVSAVSMEGTKIIVSCDVGNLQPSEGGQKWIGIGISTGLLSITKAEMNGTPFTANDAARAVAAGLDREGEILYYVNADKTAAAPVNIVLDGEGYPETVLTIAVSDTAGQ